MRHRYSAGAISELNVARAKTERASAKSQAMSIARQRAEAEHALAILLGTAPADFTFTSSPLEPMAIDVPAGIPSSLRSEEHTSELQSLMRISYAVFC